MHGKKPPKINRCVDIQHLNTFFEDTDEEDEIFSKKKSLFSKKKPLNETKSLFSL